MDSDLLEIARIADRFIEAEFGSAKKKETLGEFSARIKREEPELYDDDEAEEDIEILWRELTSEPMGESEEEFYTHCIAPVENMYGSTAMLRGALFNFSYELARAVKPWFVQILPKRILKEYVICTLQKKEVH